MDSLKNIVVGIGGFHCYLTGWKSLGELFANPIAEPFFSLSRNGTKQPACVFDNDPGRFERETYMVENVLYFKVTRSFVRY